MSRLLTGLILAATLGFFVAACAPAAAPPTPGAEKAKEPSKQFTIGPDGWPTGYLLNSKQGGRYRPSGQYAWNHNDPHQTLTGGFWTGLGWAYSGLLLQSRGPGIESPTYILVPDLAERWEQPDDVTFVFYLRKGVKFHNLPPVNGREMTSEDVVYSLKRMATPGWTNAFIFDDVKSIEAPDKYTVKITLKQPSASFPYLISHGYVSIVAKEHVEQSPGGDLRQAFPPIGTGPFMVTKAESRIGVWAKRNPDFYLKDLPHIDEIEAVQIPDLSTRMSAFRTKKIDANSVTPEEFKILTKQYPELVAREDTNPGSGPQFGMKLNKSPYNDVRVRQAISKAINRQEIIDTVYFGAGILSLGFTVPGFDWLLPQEEMAKTWKQDIEGAKKLLAEAGYPNGFNAEFVVANYGETYISEAQMIQDYLSTIGIKATMKIIDQPTYVSHVLAGGGIGFNDFYDGPISPTPELDQNLAQYETGTSKNNLGLSDPKLDKMILAQRREMNREKRKAIFLDIQRYLLEQSYMWMSRGSVSTTLMWPYVKDYYSNPSYSRALYYRIWIDSDDPSFKGRP